MNSNVYEPVKPIVQTKYGLLRGVTYGGVNIFMGIRYATAGRFAMPREPEHWDGIKDALKYGHISPYLSVPDVPFYYRGLFLHHCPGEDCQNLNIWAPKSQTEGRKPVFVWFHGGGFASGSSLEEYSFDGLHLAQEGDIVFVSVNHRLNILGYMNLAEYGEAFSESTNHGIYDLTMALRWIHDNIAAFGGDPGNVTICGHSGGGAKVLSMFQMKEVADCFQRGICLSGTNPAPPPTEWEDSLALTRAMLDTIGITKENIQDIYTVPYEVLVGAYKKVARQLWNEGRYVVFEPQKTAKFPGIPPFDPFEPCSARKPLLISTTLGEFGRCSVSVEEKHTMTVEQKEAYLRSKYGSNADKLIKLFRGAFPTHDILDLSYLDTIFRVPALNCADAKSAQGSNNTYVYLSAYNMAEDEGIPMWHGGDVCYAFLNEDRVYVANEAVDGPQKANIFSSVILNFCRNGNPNNCYLPEWPPYTPGNHVTMVIDRESYAKADVDAELAKLALEISGPFRVPPMHADERAKPQIGV